MDGAGGGVGFPLVEEVVGVDGVLFGEGFEG